MNNSISKKTILTLAVLSMLILGGCTTPWGDKNQNPEVVGKTSMYLFVQNAVSGSFIAVEGEDNLFTLSLNGVSPQTIYFSDRPERNVGQVEMQTFLDNMCFKEENPPNAALEILGADENSDLIVVELFDPIYDTEKNTLQYKAKILEDANHSIAVYNERHDKSIPQTFNESALFIDSCPDIHITCYKGPENDSRVCGDVQCCQCWKWDGLLCTFKPDCCSLGNCDDKCKAKYGKDCHY